MHIEMHGGERNCAKSIIISPASALAVNSLPKSPSCMQCHSRCTLYAPTNGISDKITFQRYGRYVRVTYV